VLVKIRGASEDDIYAAYKTGQDSMRHAADQRPFGDYHGEDELSDLLVSSVLKQCSCHDLELSE